MGQFFNQPDFATEAKQPLIATPAQAIAREGFLDSACLYVGVGGDLVVLIAGGDPSSGLDYRFFKNVPSGSILPVTVDFVMTNFKINLTTASEIIALK
tara:strand:- start:939 stop:1232 length:294 start_codon:yes stop_codon:yes gene_type:complete